MTYSGEQELNLRLGEIVALLIKLTNLVESDIKSKMASTVEVAEILHPELVKIDRRFKKNKEGK